MLSYLSPYFSIVPPDSHPSTDPPTFLPPTASIDYRPPIIPPEFLPTPLPPSPATPSPSPPALTPIFRPPTTPQTIISPTFRPVTVPNLPPSSYTRCGSLGWRRVVYLNMTDPHTQYCPSGWTRRSRTSTITCERPVSNDRNKCYPVTFPVRGGNYTTVCGRIIAYQSGLVRAFRAYDDEAVTTINDAYVDGVSITHGNPRQHIWTFAAGYTENHPVSNYVCPCDATINIDIPEFVGGDYFCESGWNSGANVHFFKNDPLWDGKGCLPPRSTCCSFNDPPYFTKQLPSPTADDLEVRICQYDRYIDTPIEFIELYVQ